MTKRSRQDEIRGVMTSHENIGDLKHNFNPVEVEAEWKASKYRLHNCQKVEKEGAVNMTYL